MQAIRGRTHSTEGAVEPTRRCSKCGEAKPETAFSPSRIRRHCYWCRACCNAYTRSRYASKPEFREGQKARSREWGSNNRERAREWHRAWRERNRTRVRTTVREWRTKYNDRAHALSSASARAYRARHPERVRARYILANALRDGKILRPSTCSRCHVACKPHGHHEDYSRPLDVTWLCAPCHREVHRQKRAETRAA